VSVFEVPRESHHRALEVQHRCAHPPTYKHVLYVCPCVCA
jgi:hypothetical protein